MIVLLAAGIAAAADAGPKAPQETLDIAVLTPRDGIALNAASLDIQTLVSARRAGRSDDDVWTGWMRVDLAIDGVFAQTLDPTVCRGQIVAGFRTSLTNLSPGPHVATVTASKKTRGALAQGSASFNFVIDPTLPARELDRVEDAASPKPFACLSTPDHDPDDDDRSDDNDMRFATLRGSFVANALGRAIDLARDRVVLAIDGRTVAIEPGSFVCRAHNDCRFADGSGGLVRRVRLEEKKKGRWTFTIATRRPPSSTQSLFLRIGANWGGLDYAHDAYIATMTPTLDAAHRGSATVGVAGGSVQTIDADGVVIRLSVPPGALTRDTFISATPLAAPALEGQTPSLHFGVKFEPEGLVFATPTALSVDFTAASVSPGDADFIYLLTSPMTRIPLVGNSRTGKTLTASLSHFSTVSADGLAPLFGNLVDWDPRLTDAGALTFTELARLAEDLRVQSAMGCDPGAGCAAVNAAYNDLIAEVSDSMAALMPSCSADIASPTRAAFDHWKTLIGLAQGLGLNNLPILDCARNVLDALVNKTAADGLAHPSDAAVDALDELEQQAQSLAFATVAANAHAKKHDVLQAVIDQAGATAAGDPSTTNLQRMIGLKARAQTLAFADLERRVLEKSVSAARTAISRLQTACDADATAPATDVAKELARTWVTFISLDPTVAPTLSSDLQSAIDNCGGSIATVFGDGNDGFSTGIYLSGAYNLLPAPGSLPLHMSSSADGMTIDLRVSASGKIVGMDVDIDATVAPAQVGVAEAFATLDFTFPKDGTLKMEVSHGWLVQFDSGYTYGVLGFVREPAGFPTFGGTVLINNCLSSACVSVSPLPDPGAPSIVTIPVVAGRLRVQAVVASLYFTRVLAHGRAVTFTFTPAP